MRVFPVLSASRSFFYTRPPRLLARNQAMRGGAVAKGAKPRQLINPRRACAARVTVLGLSVCVCVCLSACLSTFTLKLQATKRHVNGTLVFSATRARKYVADLAKTAAFWQEKPAPPWATFRDPTHQLARCECVFITRLLDWLSPLRQHCPGSCVAVNATSNAASLFLNRFIRYQGI